MALTPRYDKSKSSTRTYEIAALQRVAVGAAEADSAAIDAIEVCLHASTRCFVVWGAAPQAATAAAGLPLEAGEKFHLQLTPGDIVSVIRDTADGYLHILPVA